MRPLIALLFFLAACGGDGDSAEAKQAATVVHHRVQCKDMTGTVVIDTVDVDAAPRTGPTHWQWANADGDSRMVSVPPLICAYESWKGEENATPLIKSEPPPAPEPESPKPMTWEKEEPYESVPQN